jgi:Flp pilus assembly protein TadD
LRIRPLTHQAMAGSGVSSGRRSSSERPLPALGNLYAGLGRAADAERVLTEGRRIDPNNMFIITTLGNFYAAQGRAADAERVD